MTIGIDLRALQTGHKYRGIGEVTKQVANRVIVIATAQTKDTDFIFYEYDDDDPKVLLTIPQDLQYRVIKQGVMPEGLLPRSKETKVKDAYDALYGSPVKGSSQSDVFLQFDYAFGVPTDSKTLLIKHDLIPLVFKRHYFESAWVPFKNYAARTTMRTIFANHKYNRVLRRSLRRAKKIATVSDSTKHDIMHFFGVNPKKIITTHLGVSVEPAKTGGSIKPSIMPTKPYLLFVGAGDARRRVDDLVAAYNNLKAAGHDIQLVLAGENFPNPTGIPNKMTRDAVLDSSYGSDILTVGYVDDATKQELFKNAIAFVYPTLYEGFGIPVLEAMLFDCPVITYKNSSIPEVAADKALFAHDWKGIYTLVVELLAMPAQKRKKLVKAAHEHAETFTWERMAQSVYDALIKL